MFYLLLLFYLAKANDIFVFYHKKWAEAHSYSRNLNFPDVMPIELPPALAGGAEDNKCKLIIVDFHERTNKIQIQFIYQLSTNFVRIKNRKIVYEIY